MLNVAGHHQSKLSGSSPSSLSSLHAAWDEFAHSNPLQWPHATEQSMSCLLHVHLRLLQSVLKGVVKLVVSQFGQGHAPHYSLSIPVLVAGAHLRFPSTAAPGSTHEDWYFAAADVRGKLCGCTWEVLVATLSQMRLCRDTTSVMEADCVSNTVACWQKSALVVNFLRGAPFPMQ